MHSNKKNYKGLLVHFNETVVKLHMKIVYYCLFLSLFIVSCFNADTSNISKHVVINLDNVEKENASLSDFFSNIEFIPLENNPNCMLSHVEKMEVTDKGFILLDRSNMPTIQTFAFNGEYTGKIGDVGKAKGEFQNNVFDICSSVNGDTIAIATQQGIMLFDNGKYNLTKAIDKGFVKRIQSTLDGFVYCSDYSDDNHSLHILDKNLNVQIDLFNTNGMMIGNFGATHNTIQTYAGDICYYDQYQSCFYCIKQNQLDDITQIKLESKNILNYDSYNDEKLYIKPYDSVMDYYIINGNIYGNMCLSHALYFFKLNISNASINIYDVKGWLPRNGVLYGDNLYCIISQDDFLSLSNMEFEGTAISSIENNYHKVKGLIHEKSNFIIVKLKFKYL